MRKLPCLNFLATGSDRLNAVFDRPASDLFEAAGRREQIRRIVVEVFSKCGAALIGKETRSDHAASITFAAASRLAASATLSISEPLSIRFMNPLSAVPGPSSIKRVNPCESK